MRCTTKWFTLFLFYYFLIPFSFNYINWRACCMTTNATYSSILTAMKYQQRFTRRPGSWHSLHHSIQLASFQEYSVIYHFHLVIICWYCLAFFAPFVNFYFVPLHKQLLALCFVLEPFCFLSLSRVFLFCVCYIFLYFVYFHNLSVYKKRND